LGCAVCGGPLPFTETEGRRKQNTGLILPNPAVDDPDDPDCVVRCCGERCADALTRRTPMLDPGEREVAALEHAGQAGGEYLDRLGKTDLADLDENQWRTFLGVVVVHYQHKMRELEKDAKTAGAESEGTVRRAGNGLKLSWIHYPDAQG
jgi:hypothetical protein